jgi:transposase
MFIREIKKRLNNNGTSYEYIQHRLVESVRTEHGPRQQTILNLGTLTIPGEQLKTLANLIEENLLNCNQSTLFGDATDELIGLARHFADVILQKRIIDSSNNNKSGDIENVPPHKTEPSYETIDTNSIVTSNSRTIGTEHIALTQLKELGLFAILEQCSFTDKEQKYAAAQICARMVHPASERETARWLRDDSALAELLDVDFSHLSDQMLHRITDKLSEHKDYIEKSLSKSTTDLFNLDNKLILYDLTNTYFESPKVHSSIAKYGKSKEKRKDCPLITLALVVDGMGFPKRSRILAGNIAEAETLLEILDELDIADNSDDYPRTIVMDAGIATEDNLRKLREDKRFEYVAISRKKNFGEVLFTGTTEQKIQMSHEKELTIETVKYGEETLLRCKSPDRSLKDEAIHVQRKERFEKGLIVLNDGLKKPRGRKKIASIHEKIGRLKERYSIGHLYTIDVHEENGYGTEIVWKYNTEKEKRFGEYIIRTSRSDLDGADISGIHRTLTMIEAAFEWLKSDLGLRPNFHQKDSRMSAHAIISVMAYFVLAPILNKMEWGGKNVSYSRKKKEYADWNIPFGWKGLVRTMSSQTRVTTSFECKDATRIDARTTVEPTAQQLGIYSRLQMSPRPLKRIITRS